MSKISFDERRELINKIMKEVSKNKIQDGSDVGSIFLFKLNKVLEEIITPESKN